MSDRILKSEQAVKGEDIVLAARSLPGECSAAQQAKRASDIELSNKEDLQLPSDRAHSEAEQIVADAEQMAHEIAAEAENKACKKREETESELAQLIDSTTRELETQRETIQRETNQRVEAEYRERYLAAISALAEAARELRADRERYLAEIEGPALKLVLEVARQLLGREISRSPELIAKLIARAVELLKPERVVSVHVHPAAFMLLSEDDMLTDALRESGIHTDLVDLAIDESLQPDQFSAKIDGTSIDYNMSAAVDELAQQLEEQTQRYHGHEGNDE